MFVVSAAAAAAVAAAVGGFAAAASDFWRIISDADTVFCALCVLHAPPPPPPPVINQLLRTMRFFLYKRKDAVAQWSRNQQSAQINHEKEVRGVGVGGFIADVVASPGLLCSPGFCAPSRKGCGVNGQMTKASNK